MYRLTRSSFSEAFVLKGAMLYVVWAGSIYRPTKDLDFLALNSASPDQLAAMFRKICLVEVIHDAMVFAPDSVRAEAIREYAVYQGVRVRLEARLGKIVLPLQVDVGFGDAVVPKARKADFPPLLEFPAPRLAMYGRETVVAEKSEAMVTLGLGNSRMKEYYDVWTLSQEFDFDGQALSAAIRATFRRRRTDLPSGVPMGLSDDFAADSQKQRQWQGFIRRSRLAVPKSDLTTVVGAMRAFLVPAFTAAGGTVEFDRHWTKGGPWHANE